MSQLYHLRPGHKRTLEKDEYGLETSKQQVKPSLITNAHGAWRHHSPEAPTQEKDPSLLLTRLQVVFIPVQFPHPTSSKASNKWMTQ